MIPRAGAVLGRRSLTTTQPPRGAVRPFAVRTLDGRTMRLDELRGRPVILDFWATGCAPCRTSMPQLSAMQIRCGTRGLVIVGLSVDDATSQAAYRGAPPPALPGGDGERGHARRLRPNPLHPDYDLPRPAGPRRTPHVGLRGRGDDRRVHQRHLAAGRNSGGNSPCFTTGGAGSIIGPRWVVRTPSEYKRAPDRAPSNRRPHHARG